MTFAERVAGTLPDTGTVRWRLLDSGRNEIGEVHPSRPGIDISNDGSRKAKRTARGYQLPEDEAADVDEFADRLGPVWVDPEGTEWPLGVFLYADVNRMRQWDPTADTDSLEATLVDQTVIVDQPLQAGLSFPAGTNLSSMMAAVFDVYGIAGAQIDTTGLTCSEPMTWAVGRDSGWDALSDLAEMAAYWPPYFDNSGIPVLRAAVDPSAAQADFAYGRDGTCAIKRKSIVESTNAMGAPNVFLAINSGASAQPIVGRYEVPGDQPQSIAHRGFAVVDSTDAQSAPDQASANAAARAAAQKAFGEFQPVGFDTVPDPSHDTFDIVSYPDAETLNLELSWSLACDPGGDMSHNLRRLYVP